MTHEEIKEREGGGRKGKRKRKKERRGGRRKGKRRIMTNKEGEEREGGSTGDAMCNPLRPPPFNLSSQSGGQLITGMGWLAVLSLPSRLPSLPPSLLLYPHTSSHPSLPPTVLSYPSPSLILVPPRPSFPPSLPTS